MKLSAVNLKNELWTTLQELRSDKIDPAVADSVASQSREILRAIKIQLSILGQAKKGVTEELLSFACEAKKPKAYEV